MNLELLDVHVKGVIVVELSRNVYHYIVYLDRNVYHLADDRFYTFHETQLTNLREWKARRDKSLGYQIQRRQVRGNRWIRKFVGAR